MKKFVLALLIIQVVCFSLIFSASADSAADNIVFAIEAETSVVKAGQEFTVEISIEKNDGFLLAVAELQYDKEVLSFIKADITGADFTELTQGSTTNPTVFTIGTFNAFDPSSNPTKHTGTGRIATVTFKALADVDKTTALTITARSTNVMNLDGAYTYTVGSDTLNVTVISPSHTHTLTDIAPESPTCTQDGKTAGIKCSVCGEILSAQMPVTAPGHTPATIPAVTGSCTTDSKSEGSYCSVCNEPLVAQVTTPAPGHTEVIDAAEAATCTKAGKTEGKHCSVCNEVLVAQTEVPAKGHTPQDVAEKAATCTENGLTAGKKCTTCGEFTTAQQEIPAKGHTEEDIPGIEATWNKAGMTTGKRCTVCGATTLAQQSIPATGMTTVIIILVAVVVLLIAAGVVVFVVFKNKIFSPAVVEASQDSELD